MPMKWNTLYGLRNYLQSSLWLVPFIAIPLALVVTRITASARPLARVDVS